MVRNYRRHIEVSQIDATGSDQPIKGSEGFGLVGVEISKDYDRSNYAASLFWHHNRQKNVGEEQEDTIWSGALTARWKLANGDFSAELARNFRHPTLSERFYNGTTGRGTTLGNPGLKAEVVDSLTVGYNYHAPRLNIALEVFLANASNFIERQFR